MSSERETLTKVMHFGSPKNEITFLINGKEHRVNEMVPVDTTLNTYIRNYANLKGTKYMCLEGGCGICVVSVKRQNAFTKATQTYAVNSCLVPVFACHGWSIKTIEGIGDKRKGYHVVQSKLAKLNGTQCGYCSPGMVMNMYSLIQDKQVTMQEVENSFGGNICRCTGYRPILDAFKSLCTDATPSLLQKVQDIEDINKLQICSRDGQVCSQRYNENSDLVVNGGGDDDDYNNYDNDDIVFVNWIGTKAVCDSKYSPIILHMNDSEWFKVMKIEEILNIFKQVGDVSYMLVAGNTAQGVYKTLPPKVYIDIGDVTDLKSYSTEPILTLGGNMSMSETIDLFNKIARKNSNYSYVKILADHIDLIASVPVRNIATLAGNLSLKHKNVQFPSDIFLILVTVGATLNIVNKNGKVSEVNLNSYLDTDMKHKIIQSIKLPPLDESFVLRTFKVMPRAQNAHAHVNAGFLFKFSKTEAGRVLQKPNIIYGGINPNFVNAKNTELYLYGKNLFDSEVLREALTVLDSELKPDHVLPDASPEFRKGLAAALFYKFVLGLHPPNLSARLVSGGNAIDRPLSSGKQIFDTDKSEWPLNQPVPKLEAIAQCSGEAEYINDIPDFPGVLHAAFVLTTVAQGYVDSIDPSEALNISGVVKFLSSKDIPGINDLTPIQVSNLDLIKEVFCSGEVRYAGQPLGIIVAESQTLAASAVSKVKVHYGNLKKPYIGIREAIASGDNSRIRKVKELAEVKMGDMVEVTNVITGSFDAGAQYHFTMETQTCMCVPVEDGMDVYPSTQTVNLTNVAIAKVLNIPENSINIKVRRIGGGYGAKVGQSIQVSAACAVAAYALNRPVRLIMPLETNMAAIGKRPPAAIDYDIGTNSDGKIIYMKTNLYVDIGSSWFDYLLTFTAKSLANCYDTSTWDVTPFAIRTDTPANIFCRAPFGAFGIGAIEHVMEHIAQTVKKDPIEVRINNMNKGDGQLLQMINELKSSSDYDARRQNIEAHNKAERWKKKGIVLVPMAYPIKVASGFYALVSIYEVDGTVAVCHSGIEMGQGINTKVAQVVAYTLGISLSLVMVKPSNNLTSPNPTESTKSLTSESCCYAAVMSCKELLKRMEPVKKDLKNPTWQQWVQASYQQNIDLCASYMYTTNDGVQPYKVYGVTVAEVEVDLLTGLHQIQRVDILEDAGESLSPDIDVGQIEGAFTMGLGYWLLEHLVFDPKTGALLTNRTWNYKPPGAKDIPIDFRVQMTSKTPNSVGVLRSKATGEPAVCMSVAIVLALRNALDSARKEAGQPESWYQMKLPATTENTFLASLTNINLFSL